MDFLLDECGADVNSPTNDLSRALHLAAREGHTQIVQHLINRGADTSLTDSNGRTGMFLPFGRLF